MEDCHRSNSSETAPQPGPTVQGAHISHIAQQVSSLSESFCISSSGVGYIKHFHVLGFLPISISPKCALPLSCDPSPTTLMHLP
uniref:Uncharacterized protein n=1 Tax=Castor canadensis TaxID=51338 RepID=A0A8C0W0E3_CASCN